MSFEHHLAPQKRCIFTPKWCPKWYQNHVKTVQKCYQNDIKMASKSQENDATKHVYMCPISKKHIFAKRVIFGCFLLRARVHMLYIGKIDPQISKRSKL